MVQERIDQLERDYRVLLQRVDRLDQIEKGHDFTIRDSSVKIGIAEGLAEKTFKELSQLKVEMVTLRAEMKELRQSNDQQFERIEKKIDTQFENLMQKLDSQSKWSTQKLDSLEKMLQQVISKLP